jgi:hypothetical protein
MLITALQNEPTLNNFLKDRCEEEKEKMSIAFDPSVSEADYVIIKVDDYFNKTIHPNPNGIDCLIVQKCADNRYRLYLIELKNIKEIVGGTAFRSNIILKFQNTFHILMSDHFRHLFYGTEYDFSSIELFFVSRIDEKEKKQKNTKLDALLALPPFRFANRRFGLSSKEPYVTPC